MALCARSASRTLRSSSLSTKCRRIRYRNYSTAEDARSRSTAPEETDGTPAWFKEVRQEMLKRPRHTQMGAADYATELQLYKSLRSFVPQSWEPVLNPEHFTPSKPQGTVGHHLIYCNTGESILFPDGTDDMHAPGEPFVRRMWAGGSLRVNAYRYTDHMAGWKSREEYVCAERIRNVRLSGTKKAILVTVERRFARVQRLAESQKHSNSRFELTARKRSADQLQYFFKDQLDSDDWGDAVLFEERDLIFMPERSEEELKDIRAGKKSLTRYLEPPGIPEFSEVLTPTSAMLFRFSALTFNAHAVHLDREYARNVEGHHNLLVHGPLTLLLMIKLVSAHLYHQPSVPHIVDKIEYRNLVPLYCDEEMRLCARERIASRREHSRSYDVWINGPTGGMAVKAVVRTRTVTNQDFEEKYSSSSRIPIKYDHSAQPGNMSSPNPAVLQSLLPLNSDANAPSLVGTPEMPKPSLPLSEHRTSALETSHHPPDQTSPDSQSSYPANAQSNSSNSFYNAERTEKAHSFSSVHGRSVLASSSSPRVHARRVSALSSSTTQVRGIFTPSSPPVRVRRVHSKPPPMIVRTSRLTRFLDRRINPWAPNGRYPAPGPPTAFARHGARRVTIKKPIIRKLQIKPSYRFRPRRSWQDDRAATRWGMVPDCLPMDYRRRTEKRLDWSAPRN